MSRIHLIAPALWVRSGLRIVLNDSVYRMIERDQHRDIFQMLARETAEDDVLVNAVEKLWPELPQRM